MCCMFQLLFLNQLHHSCSRHTLDLGWYSSFFVFSDEWCILNGLGEYNCGKKPGKSNDKIIILTGDSQFPCPLKVLVLLSIHHSSAEHFLTAGMVTNLKVPLIKSHLCEFLHSPLGKISPTCRGNNQIYR
jgi:hypothetical protein